jgi:hypothetical protein
VTDLVIFVITSKYEQIPYTPAGFLLHDLQTQIPPKNTNLAGEDEGNHQQY